MNQSILRNDNFLTKSQINSLLLKKDELLQGIQENKNKNQKLFQQESCQSNITSQILRKAKRQKQQFQQCKKQITKLLQQLKSEIQPAREHLIMQIVSKHSQISNLAKQNKTFKQQALTNKQQTIKLTKQIKFQQKQLSQLVLHKRQITQSVGKIQTQILELIDKKKHLQVIQKSKSLSLKKKSDQIKDVNNFDNNKPKYFQRQYRLLQENMKNALKFNFDLKQCLSKRSNFKLNLTEAIKSKEHELKMLNKQNTQYESQIQIIEQKLHQKNQQLSDALRQKAMEQASTNHIIMQNTELKARLEILRHSLDQENNTTNLNHDKIYQTQKLLKQAQFANQQTYQMLQKLIKIKLQAEYFQSRAKIQQTQK